MRGGKEIIAGAAVLTFAACGAPPRPITENQEPIARLELPERAVAGEAVELRFDGTRDVDGAIVALRVEPGDDGAPLELAPDAQRTTHTFTAPGLYVVALVATDDAGKEGRARVPLLVEPGADVPPPIDDVPPEEDGAAPEVPPLDPAGDDDADGLVNAEDPAPTSFNGLRARFYELSSIPRDLLARQKAEDVVAELEDAEPLAVLPLVGGWEARDESEEELSMWIDGAPARAERFAVRLEGVLTPPPGAHTLEVELGADDLAVVFIDGEPVASADEEYALDAWRTERVPSASGPIELFGPVDIDIVLANDGGPYAWALALTFRDAEGDAIEGAPTQASYRTP